jgi:hypothetical protein
MAATINRRFAAMEATVNATNVRIGALERAGNRRFAAMEATVNATTARLNALHNTITAMAVIVQGVRADLVIIIREIEGIKAHLTVLDIAIHNGANRAI